MPLQVKQSFVVRTDSTANFEVIVATRQSKPVCFYSIIFFVVVEKHLLSKGWI